MDDSTRRAAVCGADARDERETLAERGRGDDGWMARAFIVMKDDDTWTRRRREARDQGAMVSRAMKVSTHDVSNTAGSVASRMGGTPRPL